MQIAVSYEKRDWGSGQRAWREVPAVLTRYAKHTSGPSEFSIRPLSRRKAKRRQFGAALSEMMGVRS